MAQQDYVYGDWIDSSGAVYPVRFKKKWGEHLFSEEESKVLLQGDNVVFPYKKGTINGHLQYRRTQDGTRYFGFCPDFDNEYIGAPIYNPTVDSRFEGDRMIIPELSEPPVRILGATIPENESHIFR